MPGSKQDHSTGIAINSLLQTDEHSHLEMVRYGAGSGFFRALVTAPHVAGGSALLVLFRIFMAMLLRPLLTLRTLFVSEHVDALRKLHPDNPRIQRFTEEDRVVVSEPPGDLPGAWLPIAESTALIIQPGADEQRPFQPHWP